MILISQYIKRCKIKKNCIFATMKTEEIKAIKNLILQDNGTRNIVIVTHRNPDGDAYGSSLALYHFLKKINHEVTVISPNDCPNFLQCTFHFCTSSMESIKIECKNYFSFIKLFCCFLNVWFK